MKTVQEPINPEDFIEALYQAFLRRRPNAKELANKLERPHSDAAHIAKMIEGFLVSSEFIQRLPQISKEFGPLRRALDSEKSTIFSIGVPGAFSDWCEAAATFAAGMTHRMVEGLSANTTSELGIHSLKSKAGCVIVSSRQPDRHIFRALSAGERPFLTCIEPPRSAVGYLVTQRGWDLPRSIRAVSASYATLTQFVALPSALVLRADQMVDERAATTKLANHLGLTLSDQDLAAVIHSLHATGRDLSKDWLHPWWDEQSPDDQALIDGALGSYLDLLENPDSNTEFYWGRELFVRGDDPTTPMREPIDITGRARCLSHGPGLLIPPGTWTARIVIGFSKETVGMSFMLEAISGKVIGQTRLQPNRAGIVQTDINFTVDAQGPAFGHPFQIRLSNERAAFDGRVAIGDVTLSRQTKVRPEIERELAETLQLTQ